LHQRDGERSVHHGGDHVAHLVRHLLRLDVRQRKEALQRVEDAVLVAEEEEQEEERDHQRDRELACVGDGGLHVARDVALRAHPVEVHPLHDPVAQRRKARELVERALPLLAVGQHAGGNEHDHEDPLARQELVAVSCRHR